MTEIPNDADWGKILIKKQIKIISYWKLLQRFPDYFTITLKLNSKILNKLEFQKYLLNEHKQVRTINCLSKMITMLNKLLIVNY